MTEEISFIEEFYNFRDIHKQIFNEDTNLWLCWSSNQNLCSLYHLYSSFCSSLGYLQDRVHASQYWIPFLSYYLSLDAFNMLTENCRLITIFDIDTSKDNEINIIGFIGSDISPELYRFRHPIFFDPKYYTAKYMKEVAKILYTWVLIKYSHHNKTTFPAIQVPNMLPITVSDTDVYFKDLYPIFKPYLYCYYRLSQSYDLEIDFNTEPVFLKHIDISNVQEFYGVCNRLIDDSEKYFIADANAAGTKEQYTQFNEQDYLYYYLKFMENHESHLAFIYLNDKKSNEPIGLIEYITPRNRPAYIHKVYLDPQYRKHGYGQSVFKQVFYIFAKNLNILPMHDLVIYEPNRSVINFYEKLDYYIYSTVLIHQITKEDYNGLTIAN